jgi:hypothetical protein
MHEGIAASANLNECAELKEARDTSLDDISRLDQAGHILDDLTGSITACTIRRCDVY